MVSVNGHNEALGTTKTTVAPTLDTADLDQSVIAATPSVVSVASTDADDLDTTGTGMRSCTLSGLDSSGNAQSEAILMNGVTEVASSLTYSAVLGLEALTWGSTNANEGVIWAGTGTFTAGVPAVKLLSADVGHNRALTAYYVVPLAKTFVPQQITVNASSASKAVEVFVETSSDGLTWFAQAMFGFDAGGSIVAPVIGMDVQSAGTHIRLQGKSSAATTDITAILTGMLIDD